MADRSNERWVAQLPSTANIEDSQVREYLDALTNAWQLRNGTIGALDDARFITKGEFQGMTERALGRVFSGEVGGPTVPGGPGGPGTSGELIGGLQNWVLNSELYRRLTARIQNLEVPWDTINRVNSMVTSMNQQIQGLLASLGFDGHFPDGITNITSWVNNTATQLNALQVTVDDDHWSAIVSLQQVTDDMAIDFSSLSTTVGGHTNSISTLLTTTDTNATSISNMQSTLGSHGTSLNNLSASITEINNVETTSTSAAATWIRLMRATLSSQPGPVGRTYWQTTQPTGGTYQPGDMWVDTDSDPLYQRWYWNGSSWQAGVYGFKDFVDAGILSEHDTRVSQDLAIARAVQTLWAIIDSGSSGGSSSAIIEDGDFAGVTPYTATAGSWVSLQSAVFSGATNLVAQVTAEFNTFVDGDTERAEASFLVRTSVGGNIAGFGLMQRYLGPTTDDGGGPPVLSSEATSSFGVVANSFWIASPTDANVESAPSNKVPFIVLTSPQTFDGRPYPAGTYITTAFIAEATIDIAKITQHINSSNFNGTFSAGGPGEGNITGDGTVGWAIDKSGYAVFSNVTVRGTSSVGRLVVTGAVSGSVYVEDNAPGAVTHNEGRSVVVTSYTEGSGAEVVYVDTMDNNSFSLRAGFSGAATLTYRYF